MQQDKYYKEIEKKFSAKNSDELLKTIKDIRHTGKADIIPLLFDLINKNSDAGIKNEIFILLGQLKDKNSVPFIIDEIKNKRSDKYMCQLITTCWQSGLDYSDHILIFAEKFVGSDYITSIEAFTVIEEWIHNSDKEVIRNCKKYLVDNINKIETEKKALYIELVKVFENHI